MYVCPSPPLVCDSKYGHASHIFFIVGNLRICKGHDPMCLMGGGGVVYTSPHVHTNSVTRADLGISFGWRAPVISKYTVYICISSAVRSLKKYISIKSEKICSSSESLKIPFYASRQLFLYFCLTTKQLKMKWLHPQI